MYRFLELTSCSELVISYNAVVVAVFVYVLTDIVVIVVVGDDGGDDVVEVSGASGRRESELGGKRIANSLQSDLLQHRRSRLGRRGGRSHRGSWIRESGSI